MTRDILRVCRTKEQAKESYNKISKFYGYFTWFEKKYSERELELLDVQADETVLEIGFGTGYCFKRIAESVGENGKAYGIDISPEMLKITKRRLERARLIDRVELYCGDSVSMPYKNDMFDAVSMNFTLELFDTPEIPRVLSEIKRVLKPSGRLGVASMSNENGGSIILSIYNWIHQKFPKYIDCRPIFVEESVKNAGYEIKRKEKVKLFGLHGEIVIGVN